MSRFPHALVIIVSFIILAGVATYLLPKGEYDRTTDPQTNSEVVVPGSFHDVEAPPLKPFAILVAIPRGIVAGIEVIISIFICGACFYVVEKTGALKTGIIFITNKLKGREQITLWLTGIFFLIGGTLEGMEEELIPLTPVLLMLTRRIGYNAFVAIGVSYCVAVIGASMSPFNPFGAVLAQKLAGVTLLSGAAFRFSVMVVAFVVWMMMIMRYARNNRLTKEHEAEPEVSEVSGRHSVILVIVVLAFAALIYGMMFWEWGFNEMSAEFFLVGVLAGLFGGLGINGTSVAFVDGLREMTFAALIVGFAHGIPILLTDGKVLDTIIYALLIPTEALPSSLSAVGMMASQSILHIVVPSYTGLAALTIPILAPLSDLIGLPRQVCVLAFQYGAILMNMISPTNGAIMAIIALSGIGYDQWFKFVIRRLLVVWAFCALVLILARFFV
ncbi:MAG: YfcC family protein [Cyclobacteriaceae bacterium]|nr:YfcC family protein [Cyclobacteriaceae bacterium]